jgi:hypothetical protein
MKRNKIDKVIEAFRNYINLKEEMMTTQSTPTKAGFSSDADSTGPTAGKSNKMFLSQRPLNRKYSTGGKGSRTNWLNFLKK